MAHHELVDRLAAAATARPARVRTFGAWQVRADPELPFRRSNCTIPFAGGPPFDPGARLDEVEAAYRALGLAPRVQIVPSSDPSDLDARLAERGFEVDAPVDVLVADLDDVVEAIDGSTSAVHVDVAPHADLDVLAPFAEEPAAWTRMLGVVQLVDEITPPSVVATATIDREIAGFGVGVIDEGWLGVFGMRTRPKWRRRGTARALLGGLAQHAIAHGAIRAYLQVETDNPAARALYASAGFRLSHSYHYRVLR